MNRIQDIFGYDDQFSILPTVDCLPAHKTKSQMSIIKKIIPDFYDSKWNDVTLWQTDICWFHPRHYNIKAYSNLLHLLQDRKIKGYLVVPLMFWVNESYPYWTDMTWINTIKNNLCECHVTIGCKEYAYQKHLNSFKSVVFFCNFQK